MSRYYDADKVDEILQQEQFDYMSSEDVLPCAPLARAQKKIKELPEADEDKCVALWLYNYYQNHPDVFKKTIEAWEKENPSEGEIK